MDKELAGNYPIIIEGRETGTLNVSRDGLFWCFEANSDACDGIIRLSVFGDEGEGYLGVMEPRENRLRLKKKLSRNALSGFPARITHAGKRGESAENAPMPIKASAADPAPSEAPPDGVKGATPTEESRCATCGETDEASSPAEKPPPQQEKMIVHRQAAPPSRMPQGQPQRGQSPAPQSAQNQKGVADSPALIWRRCGYPAAYLSSMEGKSFFGKQKNVMDATDGTHIYLAVPESAAEHTREQAAYFKSKLSIMGEPYLICKLKNGRVI